MTNNTTSMTTTIAGPSLPPHLQKLQSSDTFESESHEEQKHRNSDPGSDSDDDFMPQLPPGFESTRQTTVAIAPIGPSLPPGFTKFQGDTDHHQEQDEDEEDDLDLAGPAPMPVHLKAVFNSQNEGVIAIKEREERQEEIERIERDRNSLKREEWMLLPPKELDLQASIDPTKIRSRGFKQTSKPHSSGTEMRNQSSSLWTETPAERAQRLADEAIGKRRRAEEIHNDQSLQDGHDLEISKRKKRDRLVRQEVDQHNKSLRNSSLLDLHKIASTNVAKSKTESEKELEKKRAVVWDRESMMGINSKIMSENQKGDLIKDARGLGGRFGGGSFL